ncbi:MAG: LCP family protein [Patescibacteria group bacterium]|nr:LCP family protein [Patescibacteria group bacterium]
MLKIRRKFRAALSDVAFKTNFHEVALFMMAVALGAVFAGFLYFQGVFIEDIGTKDVQINSLIGEVGDLKQERTDLYQEILKDRAEIDSLGEQFDALGGANIDFGEVVTEMNNLKGVVNTVVEESREAMNKAYSVVSADETFDVLILGTHGSLTDTIMVASVNSELETVTLISIPRDLYVDGRKINEHYSLYGGDQMKQAVYDIIGILPEKYVVVDLQAFIDTVDAVGGIDIYVEKEIYDAQYPDGYGGYQAFYMSAGDQHMDGNTALKYARSRKSSSDFDRAKRQQEVIGAVSDKVEGMDILSDTSAAVTIFQSILDNLDTDMGLFEGLKYYSDFKDYSLETGNVLSTANYLYSTYNLYGQYILLPNGGDYGEIKGYVSELVGG